MNTKYVSPLTLENFDLTSASKPMTHHAQRFNYDGYFKKPAACGLDTYQSDDRVVAVVTELLEGGLNEPNPGTSITNRIEEIGFQLGLYFAGDGEAFFREPKEYILVEHYPQRGDGSTWDEHFDLVRFKACINGRLADPQWYRLEKEEIARLLGQEFDQEY